jgi:predicted aspartyl protease
MTTFLYPITVSGPYGQYTVEAVVDPRAVFTSVPEPALVEMGIEPIRVVRLRDEAGTLQFRQLGRALTTVAGVEDVTPVLFGDSGAPTVLGKVSLDILLLKVDASSRQILSVDGFAPGAILNGGAEG